MYLNIFYKNVSINCRTSKSFVKPRERERASENQSAIERGHLCMETDTIRVATPDAPLSCHSYFSQ